MPLTMHDNDDENVDKNNDEHDENDHHPFTKQTIC